MNNELVYRFVTDVLWFRRFVFLSLWRFDVLSFVVSVLKGSFVRLGRCDKNNANIEAEGGPKLSKMESKYIQIR